MTREQILGIIRHSLTFVGGILITRGVITEGQSQEVVGAMVTLIGSIWSIIKNKAVQ